MSKLSKLLAFEFEALKNELVTKYDEINIRVSGNWAENLEVEASKDSVTLWGPYSPDGRKPGKQPPSEAIEQWLKDKGIASRLEKEISITSLAYLIARKIGREGWKRQGTPLVRSVVTPERIQQIIDKISEDQLNDFTATILTYFKTTAL
ncbi:hypothetical protein [Flavobacterium cerinum]|uniref:Uncharacterized protein n=1 Tax=Flavobacterium cerinum TaxID=2502784 RepID=A0A3S3RJ34_9FLAO|nr:hypothetical protein [Flavobacterium cerinum]RWW99699.1 hypothetical protein EPI11_12160 [Flavobacterium cerinum]